MVDEKLAQPEDAMFERNLGHIARRGKEVEIWIRGVPESRIGFIAGLDDVYVQLCLTKNQALSQLKREDIITLDETGNSIGSYVKSGILDDDSLYHIQEKIEHFRRKASSLYPRNK